jgi:hypothetical protein
VLPTTATARFHGSRCAVWPLSTVPVKAKAASSISWLR